VCVSPTIGALVGRAAAVAEARGADKGVALLEDIPAELIKSYQPFWALRAHLCMRMQRFEEAGEAFSRAIGLCTDPSTREFLKQQACQVKCSFHSE
jgi:RNA polymerase sigma-70 factor (ECF subfamily)